MPKRRANGEGSIYKRKDGTWTAQYTDNGGKKRYLYGKTQQAVKDKLKNAIRQSDEGLQMDKSNILFTDWVDEWLEVYSRPTVRKSTYANYHMLAHNYIIPAFPKVLLRNVKIDMLQKLFNQLAVEGRIRKNDRVAGQDGTRVPPGLSHGTLDKLKKFVMLIFNQAVEVEIITKNPATKIRLPGEPNREKRVLSAEEQQRLENVLFPGEGPLRFGIYLALYTGVRIGELMALRECDFDYERRELTVCRTVNHVDKPGEYGTEIIVGSVKTLKSKRIIPLPEFVAVALKGFIDRMMQERELIKIVRYEGGLSATTEWMDDGYIFINADGDLYHNATARYTLDACLKAAGIPRVNFHVLRHTFATRCVERGFDVKSLSEVLGHTDVRTTLNIYTHATEEKKRENMEKITPLSNIDHDDIP